MRWMTVRVRDQQSHVKGKFALQKEEVINEKQAHVSASVWAAVLEGQRHGADVPFRRGDGYCSPQMAAGLRLIRPKVHFNDELSLAA